jgi:hypothetical protein
MLAVTLALLVRGESAAHEDWLARRRTIIASGGDWLLHIFVDADACPVKDEVFRVAARYELDVTLVAGSWMRTPDSSRIELQVVGGGIDVADDWIVDHVGAGDIVVTADIPLAARCLALGATVLGHGGQPFTGDNIGQALATRGLLSELRDLGQITGGPPPFEKRDRSLFLQRLDQSVNAIRRGARNGRVVST